MACGHCRLKIESELRSLGYHYLDFDMLNGIISIDDINAELTQIKRAIKKAGYTVDLGYKEYFSEHMVKLKNLYTKEDFTEALNQINASLISYYYNEVRVRYEGDIEDIINIFEIFGIE